MGYCQDEVSDIIFDAAVVGLRTAIGPEADNLDEEIVHSIVLHDDQEQLVDFVCCIAESLRNNNCSYSTPVAQSSLILDKAREFAQNFLQIKKLEQSTRERQDTPWNKTNSNNEKSNGKKNLSTRDNKNSNKKKSAVKCSKSLATIQDLRQQDQNVINGECRNLTKSTKCSLDDFCQLKQQVLSASVGANKRNKKKNKRRMCLCQATEHELLNNCISCGKIICVSEEEGPCLFCGTLVRSKNSTSSCCDVSSTTISEKQSSDYAKAVSHKNKLVLYDRESAIRSYVLDDSYDWFSVCDRTKIKSDEKQKKKISLSGKKYTNKFTLDFFKREITEESFEAGKTNCEYAIENDVGAVKTSKGLLTPILMGDTLDLYSTVKKHVLNGQSPTMNSDNCGSVVNKKSIYGKKNQRSFLDPAVELGEDTVSDVYFT